ncbi:MAG: polysaccharide biosynthesis protein, partial [Syntrophorhabdus sp.]|nr:polysaccharide biosynthesis protein [Syntrophorhabdus sp.]
MFDDKVILITGGTGSFGQKFTGYLFEHHKPRKVIIFSRDEFKQHQMAKIFPDSEYAILFFLGDIRDKER